MTMSFKYRFILSFVTLEVIFVLMIVLINFSTIEKNNEDFILYKKTSLISAAKQQLMTPIAVYDVATIDNIIGEMAKTQSVEFVKVWDASGLELSQTPHEGLDLSTLTKLESDIVNDDIKIGRFAIWLNLQKHQQDISANKQTTLILIALEILISSILSWFIGHRIAQSLHTLKNYAVNILENLDTKVPQIKGGKEIEVLAAALETMRIQINHETTELKKAKITAEKSNQAKSEFLANMSHEIRTPMNAILGFVEHLSSDETSPERKHQFDIVMRSSHQLLNIINDILDFSKIESNNVAMSLYPCDISTLIEETTALFKESADKKALSYRKFLGDNLPECCQLDQVRFKQVLSNLINNAIKFTPEKGTVTVQADYDPNTQQLYFAVVDTGIGIAKENQEKIFNAFEQEDGSTTRKFGGTGLGLAISSRLVALMGGELEVFSIPQQGSRFHFTIPLPGCNEEQRQNLYSISTTPIETKKKHLHGHILVAEDNPMNEALMGTLLDMMQITYDIATDGVEALIAYQKNEYDLILMDENMPNMTGTEALHQIRNIEEMNKLDAIPVIVVTANALSTDQARFINAGFDWYLSKPYTEDELYSVLKQFLPHKD